MTESTERVRIVVATSTCLTPEQADAAGITLVPLRVTFDGRDHRDMIDITPAEVYRLLRDGVVPTTASPTPGDYLAAFEARPGPVLCLTIGSTISAMEGAARLAAEDLPDRAIEVVETGTAAGGLRIVALAAARMAAAGMELRQLAARVREICDRVEMLGMLETVEFLARSGRVPGVVSWGSSLLRVRPVIRFRQARGSLVTLVRSPRSGLAEMQRAVLDTARRQGVGPDGTGLVCNVFQADAVPLAEELAAGLRSEAAQADLSVSEMTSAMAVHVGPGVVGVASFVDPAVAD